MRKQFRPALLAAVATAAALVPMIASGSASANVPPPTYTAAGPTRVLDTLTGVGTPNHKIAPVGPGAVLDFTVPNLPGGTTGVVLNLTATHLSGAAVTYVSACPLAQPKASCIATSALNVVAGRDISNEITVPVAPNGEVQLYNNAGSVDLIADLAGYMAGGYSPVTPTRVLDTRAGTGAAKAPVGSGGLITLTVPNLPDNTSGVLLNLTATHLTGVGASYVSACSGDETKADCSTTSALNVVAGRDISNEITVPVDSGGKVEFYNNAGSVQLVADLVGTVSDDGYIPGPPERVMDTRDGTDVAKAPVGPGHVLSLDLGPGAPNGVAGVILNVTATQLTGASVTYVSVCPGNVTKADCSATSVLNVQLGSDISNEIVVPITAEDDTVQFYNNAGSVELVADIVGLYEAPPV